MHAMPLYCTSALYTFSYTVSTNQRGSCGALSDGTPRENVLAADGPLDLLLMPGRAEMQADCMCIVYLCVPVCVIEGGGANLTLT